MRFAPLLVTLAVTHPAALIALELPGLPAAGGLADGLHLSWANDAYGPGGGTKSDDFRTNRMAVTWRQEWLMATWDHSILTTTNPTESPVLWGLPDPHIDRRRGQQRMDELTLGLAAIADGHVAGQDAWIQAGPGLLLDGALGGEILQKSAHGLIGASPDNLPYERSAVRLHPIAHAGLGMTVHLSSWIRLHLGAVSEARTMHDARWQGEALAEAGERGAALFTGLRHQGSHGERTSQTADITEDHEHGMSFVLGWATPIPGGRFSFETSRTQGTDGQQGVFRLNLIDQGPGPRASQTPWRGRLGLLPFESRVTGRGIDGALVWNGHGLPWAIGVRDQELEVPFVEDMSGRRQSFWVGLAPTSILAAGESWRLTGWSEAGLGWRHTRLLSRGNMTIDNTRSIHLDAGFARAALGFLPEIRWGEAWYGLLLLAEGTAPTRTHTAELATRYTYEFDRIHTVRPLPMEGPAIAGVLALVQSWSW